MDIRTTHGAKCVRSHINVRAISFRFSSGKVAVFLTSFPYSRHLLISSIPKKKNSTWKGVGECYFYLNHSNQGQNTGSVSTKLSNFYYI